VNKQSKSITGVVGVAFASSLAGASVDNYDESPFLVMPFSNGYIAGQANEGSCGGDKEGEGDQDAEGSCGGEKEGEGDKDGEGSCGGEKEGEGDKEGEGRCGGEPEEPECCEQKCGADIDDEE